MKKAFLLFLSFFICLNNFNCLPVICVDSPLGLAVSADNCDEIEIFKLKENICEQDFQRLEIDPQQQALKPYFLPHGQFSIPLEILAQKQLKMLPKLQNAILELCPDSNKNSFLKLGADLSHLNEVKIMLYNASGLSGNKGIYQNYYQSAPQVGEFSFETEPNLSLKDLNKYFRAFNDNATYTVDAAKIYSQYCGELSENLASYEVTLSLENPFTHILDMMTVIEFLVLNISSFPPGEQFVEYHGVLEVCVRNDLDDKTHHIIIDRQAIRTKKLEIFNSQVDFYYNGEGDGCSVNSTKWADYRSGICYQDIPCLQPRNAVKNHNYPMNSVIKAVTDFLLNFRIFNFGVFNCQHFATNTWNLITNDTLDFENAKEMTVHSKRSGLQPAAPYL